MSKKLVLAVNSLDQNYEPFAFAVVEIGSELADMIRRRKEIFDAAHAQDPGLYALHFWDSAPDYYDNGGPMPETVVSAINKVLSNDVDALDYPEGLDLSGCQIGRTEADMLVITADEFRWETAEKYGGAGVATATLGYDVLGDEVGGTDQLI